MTIALYLFASLGVYVSVHFCWTVGRAAIAGWKLGTAQYRVEQAGKERVGECMGHQRPPEAATRYVIPAKYFETRH
jgi:hypothetical protein